MVMRGLGEDEGAADVATTTPQPAGAQCVTSLYTSAVDSPCVVRDVEGSIWVAVHQGQVVGTCSVVQKPQGFYIRGMAIIPGARGLGIGCLLLEQIEHFAEAQHCKRLFLSTTHFLHRATRLYETFGFQRLSEGSGDLFGTPLFTMEKILDRGTAAEDFAPLQEMEGDSERCALYAEKAWGVRDIRAAGDIVREVAGEAVKVIRQLSDESPCG